MPDHCSVRYNYSQYVLFQYTCTSCPQAFKREIHLPRYLLLTLGWYENFWWRVEDERLNCTVEERESVLLSSLAGLNSKFLNKEADEDLTTSTRIVRSNRDGSP